MGQKMRPLVSVLLIRENAEQMTGSGCCGKLEGESSLVDHRQLFGESRRQQLQLGVLHRAVREFFLSKEHGERISIMTIDPRNQLYLVPKLWRDVWCYRPGFWAGLRTILQFFSMPAVIVNGRVISRRGRPLDPDALCHRISELLAEPNEPALLASPVARDRDFRADASDRSRDAE